MSALVKPRKTTFKHIEAEWYSYYDTLKEIARLREEITHPFDDDPDDPTIVKGKNSVRTPGDPTGRLATRLATSKQINYLTEVIEAIEKVYNALPDDYKKLVRIRYWSKNNQLTWDGIATELCVSRRQAIYWRDEIIQATSELLGWR